MNYFIKHTRLMREVSFYEAVSWGDVPAVEAHLRGGDPRSDPNRPHPRNGSVPLYIALQANRPGMMRALMAGGADPAIPLPGGPELTLLHVACRRGMGLVVDLLMDYGARVDARDSSGGTCLHTVCAYGRRHLLQRILAEGSRDDPDFIHRRDREGATALHHACMFAHPGIVVALVDAGADVAMEDSHGATPLHWAVAFGHLEIIKILIIEWFSLEKCPHQRQRQARTCGGDRNAVEEVTKTIHQLCL